MSKGKAQSVDSAMLFLIDALPSYLMNIDLHEASFLHDWRHEQLLTWTQRTGGCCYHLGRCM